MKIGIIGNGREGQWWYRFFYKRGHNVKVSDSNVETAFLLDLVDILVIAVPMRASVAVAELIASRMRDNQLVISVCGIMKRVVHVFEKHKVKNAVLMHRMIGPQVETMRGHPLIIHELALDPNWKLILKAILRDLGGNVEFHTPESHDDNTGFTQGNVRIAAFALGKILLERSKTMKSFGNVPFDGLLLVLQRILEFGPELSWDMIHENDRTKIWIDKFHKAMHEIESGGEEEFKKLFSELQTHFGKDAIARGSKVIAEAVEAAKRPALP